MFVQMKFIQNKTKYKFMQYKWKLNKRNEKQCNTNYHLYNTNGEDQILQPFISKTSYLNLLELQLFCSVYFIDTL